MTTPAWKQGPGHMEHKKIEVKDVFGGVWYICIIGNCRWKRMVSASSPARESQIEASERSFQAHRAVAEYDR